jgi:phosphate transport system substrate-binding protein
MADKLYPFAKTAQRVLMAAMMSSPWVAAEADPLLVQGASTVNRQIMEPFQAEIERLSGQMLTVIPNRSTLGVLALLEGRAHIAMLSASLDSETANLQRSMPGLPFDKLRAFEIKRTRVGIGVHPTNPVRSATREQLQKILDGRISNWTALGGPDLPIRVVLVGGGGGVTVTVEAALLKGEQASAPNKLYVKTATQLFQVVEQEPGAIGFGQLSLLKQRKVAELSADKPIDQVLYLATYGEPTPAAEAVIKAAKQVAAQQM